MLLPQVDEEAMVEMKSDDSGEFVELAGGALLCSTSRTKDSATNPFV